MIKQGAVSVNGKRINDVDLNLTIEDGMVIKVGKRRFCKIIKSMSVLRPDNIGMKSEKEFE